MRMIYTIGGTLFSLLALALGYWCTQVRWAPRIDFDIIGFLWLIQNLPPLTLVVTTFFFVGLSVYCWMRVATE